MHELSLAGGILKLVEDTLAREATPLRLRRVVVEVGALAGVEIRALEFALGALAPGTMLEGSEIAIETAPGQAWCLHCGDNVPIGSRLDACPRCAGHQLQPNGGTGLRLRELLVDDLAPAR